MIDGFVKLIIKKNHTLKGVIFFIIKRDINLHYHVKKNCLI